MPGLILTCGVAGAEKSTYARALQARGSTRFSIDAETWKMGFTGSTAVPAEAAAAIRDWQRGALGAAIDDGADVVVH